MIENGGPVRTGPPGLRGVNPGGGGFAAVGQTLEPATGLRHGLGKKKRVQCWTLLRHGRRTM